MTLVGSPKQSESSRTSRASASTSAARFPVSGELTNWEIHIFSALPSCDVSPSRILRSPTQDNRHASTVQPLHIVERPKNSFKSRFFFLRLQFSWRTIKIDKRRTLRSASARIGNPRKWLGGASWHPEGR